MAKHEWIPQVRQSLAKMLDEQEFLSPYGLRALGLTTELSPSVRMAHCLAADFIYGFGCGAGSGSRTISHC